MDTTSSSYDFTEKETARLFELQRRQNELLRPDIDKSEEELLKLDEDMDDFSVLKKRKGPTVPDLRFEKQFEASLARLKENGASNISIFYSAVIKDQIIMPFISGFAWNVCSAAWKWYRTKNVMNTKKKIGFFHGIQNMMTQWSK
ncbi:uncharacterized protein BX663DRAFT_490945 [Cokeromyces recurvatus]|uniref:uncharacterized protein n=1 Tax=Cokeromyces recurvatus TaxID=90255 RepID=UPI00221F3FA7|nr:uncharacterized protein BX663DRAFT_490945 [Cokeromyces recurvatus]KAI7907448.1 hypothetical protein BX663DRAFT_490945 [Cokeromyces recurvatus]